MICPESGWKVPILPTRIISKFNKVIAILIPLPNEKRYKIEIGHATTEEEMKLAKTGTITRDNKYGEAHVTHQIGGTLYRTKISTLRGDYQRSDGITTNRLRIWEKSDIKPRQDDIFQERLYCIQWMRPKKKGRAFEYEFRSVSEEDIKREKIVENYVAEHLNEWQEFGFIPDMKIEIGGPPRYQGKDLIKSRGWTHWNHIFNPRQLLVGGISRKYSSAIVYPSIARILNVNSKLSRWHSARNYVAETFDNQALNTIYNYGTRSAFYSLELLGKKKKTYEVTKQYTINSHPAQSLDIKSDLFITDPPYGDAVKYEEITDFFISWFRKNPPEEFSHWTWDSRRSLAIKGEDEGFRRGMVAAYRKTAEMMPDNGIQVLMFTHQSGAIWADMANIIWAAGLQVTAAWYVVTETDSALRQGANVKGTVILILRKRHKNLDTFRDDLGWEIKAAVKEQVESLVGLDKSVRETGAEGLYTDADLQMAGYAAALKVLTAYSVIDGKDMVTEAEAPRVPGKKTFVDDLIEFAVQTAVQFLVPTGFEKAEWQKLEPVERFYLKMAEVEFQGGKTLDNYQNFAKAFKVAHFDQVMSDASRANSARLKLSSEFRSALMSGDAEIANTTLRALLFGLHEIIRDTDIEDVLLHLMEVCPNYLANKPLLAKMADYLAEKRQGTKKTKTFQPDKEAEAARILAEAIRNHRL